MKTIKLKPGKEESVLRRHPWIFSGAIASLPAGLNEGDLVTVTDSRGEVLGTGHYQIGSIAVRMLEFNSSALPDDFFMQRLESAFRLRETLGLIRPDNDCYRLVHGEGDFLPGLVVDIYGDTAVMQAHSPGMHMARGEVADALTMLPGARIRNVYYKSDTTLPFKAGLDAENGYLIGQYDGNIATENGLQFNIDWLKGQKTGFFVDQRENRALLEKFARGKRVLNMFCYTGGFSVYAMRGGALSGRLGRLVGQGRLADRGQHPAELPRRSASPCIHRGRLQVSQRYEKGRVRPDNSGSSGICQTPRRDQKRTDRLPPAQYARIRENQAGGHPVHVQLLAGHLARHVPHGRVHSLGQGRTPRAHPASAVPTRRPSGRPSPTPKANT